MNNPISADSCSQSKVTCWWEYKMWKKRIARLQQFINIVASVLPLECIWPKKKELSQFTEAIPGWHPAHHSLNQDPGIGGGIGRIPTERMLRAQEDYTWASAFLLKRGQRGQIIAHSMLSVSVVSHLVSQRMGAQNDHPREKIPIHKGKILTGPSCRALWKHSDEWPTWEVPSLWAANQYQSVAC